MRGNDIILLAKTFLDATVKKQSLKVTGFTQPFAERLLSYSWPGNVRELRNTIERAVTLTKFTELVVEDLPEKIRAYKQSDLVLATENPRELGSLDEIEKRYILHVLKAHNDNRSLAARTLGLDRKTLYRKLAKYGVQGP